MATTTPDVNLVLPRVCRGMDWPDARNLLETKYDLEVDVSAVTPTLFSVKYKHGSKLWDTGSDEQLAMLSQNRGSIYEMGTYRCVCLPFLKFWSHGEKYAARLNWSTGRIVLQEKYDGHMMKMYYYDGAWRISSNGKVDTTVPRDKYSNLGGRTNADLFMEAATNSGLNDFDSQLDKGMCYCFERLHPDMPLVVVPERAGLYHIATRNMSTLCEIDDVDIGVPRPKRHVWPLSNALTSAATTTTKATVTGVKSIPNSAATEATPIDIKALQAYVNTLHFSVCEGIVALDVDTRERVKVKSASYLMVFNQTIGTHDKNTAGFLTKIWLMDEASEYLSYFKDLCDAYTHVVDMIEGRLVQEIITSFDQYCRNSDSRGDGDSRSSDVAGTAACAGAGGDIDGADLDKQRDVKHLRKRFYARLQSSSEKERYGKAFMTHKNLMVLLFEAAVSQNAAATLVTVTASDVLTALRHRNAVNHAKFTFEKMLCQRAQSHLADLIT